MPRSAADLLARVRARGGEFRLWGDRLQFRPVAAVTEVEAHWLRRHRAEVIRLLASPDPADAVAFERWLQMRFGRRCQAVGHAGPGQPAFVALRADRTAAGR